VGACDLAGDRSHVVKRAAGDMLTPEDSLGTIQDVANVSYTSPIGHLLQFGFFDAAKQNRCSVVGHLKILQLSTLCQFSFLFASP